MKKLLVILIILVALAGCFGSMIAAGYTWLQALGFDFILLLMILVIILIMKIGQAARELCRKGDGL